MESPHHSQVSQNTRFNLALIAFLLIAAFFLFTEHRAHFLGILPFLLLLACPLLHLFMHGGHGERRGSNNGAEKDSPSLRR